MKELDIEEVCEIGTTGEAKERGGHTDRVIHPLLCSDTISVPGENFKA